ncbi:DivIVA domain-containing protein [Fulvivirgaceae bacterium BMA12]|uniref:DivIVA domain-containing protein n=1 Tax=Agaribacillus aureus TaxID=3051825 RepID=A0ABT8LFL6_9BACT|nr:DivIVA domain-containing protein [Fulvivirgaceae bacterium BMA12]
MKITPLEIRQKSFEKGFRGYDKDEVNGYLLSLSQEWEKLQDELKELKLGLKNAEREVEKLRQVESSLYKTLKTAEDTGANLIDQANKAAELHLKESQMKAEGLMSDSKNQAKNIVEEAEMKARMVMEKMESEIKNLQQAYKVMENHYDNLLNDLKNLANDTLERMEKGKSVQRKHGVDNIVAEALNYSKEVMDSPLKKNNWDEKDDAPDIKLEIQNDKPESSDESTSFFDQIE